MKSCVWSIVSKISQLIKLNPSQKSQRFEIIKTLLFDISSKTVNDQIYWKLEIDCITVAQENVSLLDFTWQYIISIFYNLY